MPSRETEGEFGGGGGGTALKRNCRLVEGYCPQEKLRVSLGGGGGTALKRNCRLVEGYCPQEKLRVSWGGGGWYGPQKKL